MGLVPCGLCINHLLYSYTNVLHSLLYIRRLLKIGDATPGTDVRSESFVTTQVPRTRRRRKTKLSVAPSCHH